MQQTDPNAVKVKYRGPMKIHIMLKLTSIIKKLIWNYNHRNNTRISVRLHRLISSVKINVGYRMSHILL